MFGQIDHLEHWEWVEIYGIGYLEANASKFVILGRTEGGNPLAYWRQAAASIEKLKERYLKGLRCNRAVENKTPAELILATQDLALGAKLDNTETSICFLLALWETDSELDLVLEKLANLIRWWNDSLEDKRQCGQ